MSIMNNSIILTLVSVKSCYKLTQGESMTEVITTLKIAILNGREQIPRTLSIQRNEVMSYPKSCLSSLALTRKFLSIISQKLSIVRLIKMHVKESQIGFNFCKG